MKVKKNFKVLPRFFSSDLLTYQEFTYRWAKECLRVLKPGGYLLSFGGTRTYHRMTCAIEDAGFEIRDCIMWVYSTGFPKSLNIGKQIEKWKGWGTALKPAYEPIVVTRKSISEKNVVLNVLKWGTGGINIGECKIGIDEIQVYHAPKETFAGSESRKSDTNYYENQGRFPANLILECICDEVKKETDKIKIHTNPECPCYMLDKQSGKLNKRGASRFFYVAKASRKEKDMGLPEGQYNLHPTVKSLKLLEYLVKLVTPPNGIVLDPFIGSGTTAIACKKLGFDFIGIEKEKE
ncbi:MAG: Modification methylase HindIII [candidate division WS2 bacterium]|nr:Modification methylase HindIII [Candidatus Lithacetigena glycinireducens]